MYFLVSNATRHRYLHGSVVFRQTCTQMQSMYINKRVFFDSVTSSFQSWEAKSTIFPAHSAGHGATECLWPNSAPLRLCKDPLFHGQETRQRTAILFLSVLSCWSLSKFWGPSLAVICLCLTFPSGNDVWGFGHKNVLFCGVSTTCQVLVEACLRREGTRRPGCKTQQGAFIPKP